MCIGKLSSQRYSLLVHLKFFDTCTVLFSGFLENEVGVLATTRYVSYDFRACSVSRDAHSM